MPETARAGNNEAPLSRGPVTYPLALARWLALGSSCTLSSGSRGTSATEDLVRSRKADLKNMPQHRQGRKRQLGDYLVTPTRAVNSNIKIRC